jgi:addiction module RelE/StbE family toxin
VKIRWTTIAANDLKAAYEYVREESVVHADKLVARILSGIEMLERYPQLGREGRLEGTQELAITGTPFIVFYRIRRNQVEILGVLHAARKWPDSI